MLSILVYVLHRRAQVSKKETERKETADFANVKQHLRIGSLTRTLYIKIQRSKS